MDKIASDKIASGQNNLLHNSLGLKKKWLVEAILFAVFICAIAIDILLFGCLQQIFMYCDTLAKITIPPINSLYPILSPFLYWMNELTNKWSSY